ncbi:hypothetical protein P3S67_017829 [Capsicum chacoense]
MDRVIWDEMTDHVIELDLSSSCLVGTIDSNSSLFQLSHLQSFDLSYNKFSNSYISPKFTRFSSLTYLDLSDSYFKGDELKFGPHDFELLLQNLTQLRELDLTLTNMSSTIHLNFFSHLTTLTLKETGLYGIIRESIFHLPYLVTLDLQFNDQLSGYFSEIKWNNSASLKVLDLNEVNLSGNFLPEFLGYITSLHFLSLAYCNLRGPIPESLSNLNRLVYLVLDGNTLNGTIPSGMFSLPSLFNIQLRNDHFSGQLEDFKSNSLERIDLSNNQLQGHLPNSIQNLVNLTWLDLSFNNFSGHVDVSLFSDLKQLSDLDLSYISILLTNENKVNFKIR